MTGIAVASAFLLGAVGGWPAGAALVLTAAAVVVVLGEGRLLVPAVAVMVAGAAGAWRGVPPPVVEPITWADEATAVRGALVGRPVATGWSQRAVVDVDEIRLGNAWAPGRGRLCLLGPAHPEMGLGDRITAVGGAVPNGDAPSALQPFLRQQGCGGTIGARWLGLDAPGDGLRRQVDAVGRGLGRVVQSGATGDAGALLAGLVTGDDHALSPRRRDAFLATGTTHLTAVSGANVALLVGIAAASGAATGWRRRAAWQTMTLVAVWGYALVAGGEPPAMRAALVATGALLASRFGRRADSVTLVMVAAAIMIAVQPGQMWRLSFQLSFAASLALAAVVPALSPEGWIGWLRTALLVSVAAQVATLPILLSLHGEVSLIALPANLLVAPLVEVAFPLAALAAVAGTLWGPLGEAILLPAWLAAEGVLAVVDAFAASSRAVGLGVAPRPVAALLSATAAATIVSLSTEGRAWAQRAPESLRRSAPQARTAAVGVAAGVLALAIARWLS